MIIEITGFAPSGFGARLMARAIQEQFPHVKLATERRIYKKSELTSLGLLPLFRPSLRGSKRIKSLKILENAIRIATPSFLLSLFGYVKETSVDALFDISGYRFSDNWNVAKFVEFKNIAEHYKNRGKPVILLPQAIGPLNSTEHKKIFADILKLADLVVARDPDSYQCLKNIAVANSTKILQSPDTALFLKEPRTIKNDLQCVVVPNIRLLNKGSDKWGRESYVSFMKLVINTAIEFGYQVTISPFTTDKEDKKLAHEIARGHQRVKLIDNQNLDDIRDEISKSHLVIASRYHALITALSFGIPVLATGWAHKYETLLEEFEIKDRVVFSKESKDEKLRKIKQALDSREREQLHKHILGKISLLRIQNEQMWGMVKKLVESS